MLNTTSIKANHLNEIKFNISTIIIMTCCYKIISDRFGGGGD